jgi:hypothetical protein
MVLKNAPAEIRTELLQNSSLERYGYVNQLGLVSGLMTCVLGRIIIIIIFINIIIVFVLSL